MKLIVGLGNIDSHFAGTRHNVGFDVLDTLANDWLNKPKFRAYCAETMLNGEKALFVKPTTYYNLSGDAVLALKTFYKLQNSDILVVHDELALPFGTVRTRLTGSDAGNNGIKSVIASIGNDFARIRIGIANDLTPKIDAADFVLGHFSHEERKQLPAVFETARHHIAEFARGTLKQTNTRVHLLATDT